MRRGAEALSRHPLCTARSGVCEGGTVASTPTVMNATLDALAPLDVTEVPMPATPQRIWRAVRERAQG
jgi:carbon-monoxide dehydrogenase large subunit